MTDAEYQAWLEDPEADRVVLLEATVNVGGSETTRYISSRSYTTLASETPANTYYEPVLIGGMRVQETLSIDGSSYTTSQGDIELMNMNGSLDTWLNDVWVKRPIMGYLGDAAWPRSEFRLVYAGVVASCDPGGLERIILRLENRLQRLEGPVSETKLGGSSVNVDALLPLCFGECHNVTPLLTNAATLEYAVHDSAIEDIIEVRDNGVPVSITKNLAAGRFTLNQSAVGTITASVQGAKVTGVYYNKVADLINIIVRNYGRTDLRFTTPEIDTANFTAAAAADPQPVGLYLTDTTTVREACETLAASVGYKLVMSRAGLLQLMKIALPVVSTVQAFTMDDYKQGSFRIMQRSEVRGATKIAYCRNWTVQANLQSGIVAYHKELFAQEWLTQSANDATVISKYKQTAEAEQEPTLLLVQGDATNEATRRHNLRVVQRTAYQFETFAASLLLELCDGVEVSHNRYGLSAGVNMQVIALDIDWLRGKVMVGVLV